MNKYVVIAGTEKSATTSLYKYLLDSDVFSESIKKETDYFRSSIDLDEREYLKVFRDRGRLSFLEASPGYLSESRIASKNIYDFYQTNNINLKLVFCLRDPLSRLKSSFLFHKSRLYIGEDISFEKYFDACMVFENTGKKLYDLSEWCLSVPSHGLYYKHLSDFKYFFDEKLIFIETMESVASNPNQVMERLTKFCEIDGDFYNDYDFKQSNVTRGFANPCLQKVALQFNSIFEGFWYRHPNIKNKLMKIYFGINGADKEKVILSDETRSKILEYYKDDLFSLKESGWIESNVIDLWMEGNGK
ncbi:sulfotransferase domain-containing protein [Neptunomonas phycophila]|uniref:Sulfotransferase domain-containing protein n=1 Tax=Neptunomonas phycophila TaxID=1572645 RepID=A0AAW7XJ55_9GAMM|nr:sulfotransferase domain-containing protein [Neptunomonas phycophila]MDO6454348.1 sulfotransferase domain-containing protein [Neptunomonas phycophila]